MTTTDTRAALDAALDAAILSLASTALTEGGFHVTERDTRRLDDQRAALDRAITAHVEAEVARRLAAAPGVEDVEEAIGAVWCDCDHGARCGKEIADDDHSQGHRGSPGDQDDCDCAVAGHFADLRAAIAADRERAVEFAVDQAAKLMARRMAAEIVTTDAMISYVVGGLRAVGLLRVGPGDLDAVTWTRLAKAIDEMRRVPAELRVTPDEAQRLVEEYGNAVVGCIPAIAAGARGDGDATNAMADAIDRGNKARAALLRALGGEV